MTVCSVCKLKIQWKHESVSSEFFVMKTNQIKAEIIVLLP